MNVDCRPRKSERRQGNREEWPGKRGQAREEGQGEEAIEEGKKRNGSKVRGTWGHGARNSNRRAKNWDRKQENKVSVPLLLFSAVK